MKNKFPKLAGFEQHGAILTDSNESHAVGVCPFCSRNGKFFVNIENLCWDCKVCGRSGNFQQFLEQRSEIYQEHFRGKVVSDLALNRGLKPQTLVAWGFGWSGYFYSLPVTGNAPRHITDVRRYLLGKKPLATTGSKHSFIVPKELFGSKQIWLAEGEWDGGVIWEVLKALGIKEDVYAAPGANVLPQNLLELFFDKDVVCLYDNDDPGKRGAFKVYERLKGTAHSLRFIHWPGTLSEGYDVRDLYRDQKRDPGRTLEGLKTMLKSEPPFVPAGRGLSVAVGSAKDDELSGLGLGPEEVVDRYRKWLYLTGPEALEILFGSVFANRIEGDPLWLFFVAPPGGMKTELLMSLSRAPFITTTTSLTPHALVSGANFAGGGDPSLIPRLNGRVLVIKDFTTILSMNSLARDEIFGTLRDAFDGKTEKQFGNGIIRRYESKFGILAGVTPVIEALTSTNNSLGERFLKFKIRQAGEKEASRHAIRQALQNIKFNEAMHKDLEEIGKAVLNRKIDYIPDLPPVILERIVNLAQWVASLRGVVAREKYTGNIQFKPMTEVGTRLAKQLCKLGYGISIFKQEESISEETYASLVLVAQDTAPDRIEEIVRQLYVHDFSPNDYFSTKEIAERARFPLETTRYILQDLNLLGLVIKESGQSGSWKISKTSKKLMDELELYKKEKAWLSRQGESEEVEE